MNMRRVQVSLAVATVMFFFMIIQLIKHHEKIQALPAATDKASETQRNQ